MPDHFWMPIMGTHMAIGSFVLDEETAKKNHGGQTLQRLRERGGLDISEVIAVALKQPWDRKPDAKCALILAELAKVVPPTPPPKEESEPMKAILESVAEKVIDSMEFDSENIWNRYAIQWPGGFIMVLDVSIDTKEKAEAYHGGLLTTPVMGGEIIEVMIARLEGVRDKIDE